MDREGRDGKKMALSKLQDIDTLYGDFCFLAVLRSGYMDSCD